MLVKQILLGADGGARNRQFDSDPLHGKSTLMVGQQAVGLVFPQAGVHVDCRSRYNRRNARLP